MLIAKNILKRNTRYKRLQMLLISILIAALLLPLVLAAPVAAAPYLEVDAKAAILVDNNSGRILYAKNIDEALEPASMTKMMTEYLILEQIRKGGIAWDDMVVASEYAAWMGATGGSAIYLAKGERHTVRELFYAVAIASGNDATVALAEHIAGSETAFAKLMNEKAREMGLNDTHFVTASGYPAEELGEYRPAISGKNEMSARDAATLAWYLINDFPELRPIASQTSLLFRPGEEHFNINRMLSGFSNGYDGLDGVKTGHTSQAGYCFTATAERDNIRLISVVFATNSKEKRESETRKLLNYGFNNYERIQLVGATQSIADSEELVLAKGRQRTVAGVADQSLYLVIERGERANYQATYELTEDLVAPIKKGDVLGTISYKHEKDGEVIEAVYLNDSFRTLEQVPLVADVDVDRSGVISLFFRGVGDMFSKVYNVIADTFKKLF